MVKNLSGSFLKKDVIPDNVIIEFVRPSKHGTTFEVDENLTRQVQTLINLTQTNFKTDSSDFGICITPNVVIFDKRGVTIQIDVRAMMKNKESLEKAFNSFLALQFRNYLLSIQASPAPLNCPVDSTLVAVARKIALSLGLSDKPIEKEGASDSRFFAVNNIPTIDFAPVGGGQHGSNEWVDLNSILITTEFFVKTARELLNP